jgi:hypothetical protein
MKGKAGREECGRTGSGKQRQLEACGAGAGFEEVRQSKTK